jgi:hypothetical protein
VGGDARSGSRGARIQRQRQLGQRPGA